MDDRTNPWGTSLEANLARLRTLARGDYERISAAVADGDPLTLRAAPEHPEDSATTPDVAPWDTWRQTVARIDAAAAELPRADARRIARAVNALPASRDVKTALRAAAYIAAGAAVSDRDRECVFQVVS